MGPGGLLEASWRSLGALKNAWSAKGGLPGSYGALLDASWGALGAEKVGLNGSWPLQEQFQDRFQQSWGPKGSQKGAKMIPKADLKAIQAENDEITKLEGRLMKFLDFSGPRVSL